jgi:hypothetical protein
MEMEMEGLDADEVEEITMMALQGINVPDNTWILPRGHDNDCSTPSYPGNP